MISGKHLYVSKSMFIIIEVFAMFGIVHFTFLLGSILLGICFILTLRRYITERNFLTLIFSLFLLTYVITGVMFFARGFYTASQPEDILLFRFTLIAPMMLATLLTFFIVLPLIKQKEGTLMEKVYKAILAVVAIELVAEVFVTLTSDAVYTFTDDSLAHYSLSPFIPNYALVLVFILTTAAITFILLIQMVIRETEAFYRTKALSLLIGWALVVLGQVTFLSPVTAFLNPPLGGIGMLLLAIAVLRQPPT